MRKLFIFFLIFVSGFIPFYFLSASDNTMANKLKGCILLQVESNGEAWYVNPNDNKRYYLGRPADAFNVMRELGLGISNKDFDFFNGYASVKLAGKILLKVEDSGKAYYVNPKDLKMYYLGKPEDAFGVMRELGLGISNENLNKIDDGSYINTDKKKVEINDLLTGVVKVDCYTGENGGHQSGSGFLIKKYDKKNSYIVVTNQHVVDSQVYNECRANVINDDNLSLGTYVFGSNLRWKYNNDSDVVFGFIDNKFAEDVLKSIDIEKLNYKISNLKYCKNKVNIASKVYIIGYPAYAESQVAVGKFSGKIQARILTEGVISGYDDSVKEPYGALPYSNYYVTAEVDGGNSGGVAISEENNELCLLGIPTWVSIGNYENQGIVQNIHNIYYED